MTSELFRLVRSHIDEPLLVNYYLSHIVADSPVRDACAASFAKAYDRVVSLRYEDLSSEQREVADQVLDRFSSYAQRMLSVSFDHLPHGPVRGFYERGQDLLRAVHEQDTMPPLLENVDAYVPK